MPDDRDWLNALVQKRARETWNTQTKPYLISNIPVDALKEGRNYKEIIAPLKLRQWALTNVVPDTKVIVDTKHTARVGFIPSEHEYSFGTEVSPANVKPMLPPVPKTRRSTISFLTTLASLSNDELDEIDIPIRILVRLLYG